jgi:hypothetical protein
MKNIFAFALILMAVIGCDKTTAEPKLDLNGAFEGPFTSYFSPISSNGIHIWNIVHSEDSIYADLSEITVFDSYSGKIVNDSTIIGGFTYNGSGPLPYIEATGRIMENGEKLYFKASCCESKVRYEVNLTRKVN